MATTLLLTIMLTSSLSGVDKGFLGKNFSFPKFDLRKKRSVEQLPAA
jgi:hypothetical protein